MERVKIGEGILELKTDITKGLQGLTTFVGTADKQFSDLQNRVAQIGNLMVVQFAAKIGKAMLSTIKATADHAEQIKRLAVTYGTSVENISRLEYASKLAGTSVESVGSAMKFLSKNAIENKQEFDRLGISVKGLNGATADGHTLLLRTIDYLNKQADSGKRVSEATKLMGRGGADLLPLVAELRNAEAEADKLGITMRNSTAEAFDRFGDEIQKTGLTWDAFKRDMLEPTLPLLQEILKAGSDAMNVLKGFRDWMGDTLTGVKAAEALASGQKAILEAYTEMSPRAKENYEKMLARNKAFFDLAAENARKQEEAKQKARELVEAEIARTAELKKQSEELRKQVEAMNLAGFRERTGLSPGQAGPSRELMMPPEESLPESSKQFSEVIAQHQLLNEKLREEFEIRWAIKQGIDESAAADIEAAKQSAQMRVNSQISAMGSIAQGMEAMGANNKAMFVFQQMLSIAQMLSDATAGFTKSFAMGGWAGAAVGATIMARIMVMIGQLKSQKAPDPPKMRIPGAAEGGIISKPSIIAVAEKRPEIVMPLDKLAKMMQGQSGDRNINIQIGVNDVPGLERYLAVRLVKRAKDERLAGWGFAGA